MQILAIAATNLRRTLREPAAVFFLFLFPMLLILVLGLSFGGDFTPRVGVVADRSAPLAGALLDRLREAEGIEVSGPESEADATAAVERGDLEAALVIPVGFDAAIRAGQPAELHYVARPGQQAQQVGQIVTAVIDQESGRLRAARFAAAETGDGFDPALQRVSTVAEHTPSVTVYVRTAGQAAFPATLGRFDVGASSQLLLFLFMTALTSAAALIETRRLGVSRRLLATPVTAGRIVAGEAAGRLAISLVQGVLIMLGSALIFGVNWGDPLAAGVLLLAFALVASGAGLLMGAVARTSQQSLAFGLLLSMGLGALGGTMLPLELFPATMRTVALVTPHAWGVDAFAELVRRGGGLLDILPQIGVLFAMAAGLIGLAARTLRRAITR
jgi:ABC-2 type transport system permease protein